MTDREQIRREAEMLLETLRAMEGRDLLALNREGQRNAIEILDAFLAELEQAEKACNICAVAWPNHHENCAYVATARDLEQAEREREILRGDAWTEEQRRKQAEASLAKLPALVEALKLIASGQLVTEAISEPMPDMIDGSKTLVTYHHGKEPAQIARDALATWEQA